MGIHRDKYIISGNDLQLINTFFSDSHFENRWGTDGQLWPGNLFFHPF